MIKIKRFLSISLYEYLIKVSRYFKRKNPRNKKIIKNYFNSTLTTKLQIGCGNNILPTWLNTDLSPASAHIMFLDVSKPFPFENNSFDFIFSEHTFEHLSFSEAQNMISECYRVLKPNGVIRLATPNIEFLFNLYQKPQSKIHTEYIEWSIAQFCPIIHNFYSGKNNNLSIYTINNFFKDWGHQIIHSYESLHDLLQELNFSNITKEEINKSKYKELSNLEKHGSIIPQKFNLLETLVIEAHKKI